MYTHLREDTIKVARANIRRHRVRLVVLDSIRGGRGHHHSEHYRGYSPIATVYHHKRDKGRSGHSAPLPLLTLTRTTSFSTHGAHHKSHGTAYLYIKTGVSDIPAPTPLERRVFTVDSVRRSSTDCGFTGPSTSVVESILKPHRL